MEIVCQVLGKFLIVNIPRLIFIAPNKRKVRYTVKEKSEANVNTLSKISGLASQNKRNTTKSRPKKKTRHAISSKLGKKLVLFFFTITEIIPSSRACYSRAEI